MELASVQDFEDRQGPSDGRVEALLTDASSLILSAAAGSSAEWVTTEGAVVPDAIIAICVQIAYRAWSNPDALSSESLGAHSRAWADRGGQALRLTSQERKDVRRVAGLGSFQASTLSTPYSGDESEQNPNEELLP